MELNRKIKATRHTPSQNYLYYHHTASSSQNNRSLLYLRQVTKPCGLDISRLLVCTCKYVYVYMCVLVYHTLWFSIECKYTYSVKLISFSKTLQILRPHLSIRCLVLDCFMHETAVHLPCMQSRLHNQVWSLSPAQLIRFGPYLLVTPAWLTSFGIDQNVSLCSGQLCNTHTCRPAFFFHGDVVYCSLVLRPSHRPVFDHLQYAKTEGEGLVHFVTLRMSVSTQVDRGGGEESPDRKDTFCACILHFEPRVVQFSLREHLKLQHLGQKLQDQASNSFF